MRVIGLVLGAALASALATAVAAEPASTPPAAPAAPLTVTPPSPDMVARRLARRAARVDQDIQTLRDGLHLTPAQDKLWAPVAAAIHGVDSARGFRFRQTLAAAPSTIDAVKLQGDHMAAMGAAMSRLADTTKPLVASLSDDQKSRLPGLLQGVRLPKVLPRALGVPQDTGTASWGTGGQKAATPGAAVVASPGGAVARPPAAPQGTAGDAKPGDDDEE